MIRVLPSMDYSKTEHAVMVLVTQSQLLFRVTSKTVCSRMYCVGDAGWVVDPALCIRPCTLVEDGRSLVPRKLSITKKNGMKMVASVYKNMH